MKADGKSAKGGSDQDDKEDFWGSFWRKQQRSEKKDQRTVLEEKRQFLRRNDRRRDRKKTYSVVRELGLVLSFSAASGKSSQASVVDELQEREAMRDWSETVEVL